MGEWGGETALACLKYLPHIKIQTKTAITNTYSNLDVANQTLKKNPSDQSGAVEAVYTMGTEVTSRRASLVPTTPPGPRTQG